MKLSKPQQRVRPLYIPLMPIIRWNSCTHLKLNAWRPPCKAGALLTKIAKLQVPVRIDEHVLRLDIPVDHPTTMTIVECPEKLAHHVLGQ
eukprot:scaffold321925_cov32-Tisochrysis_lutea.AAC.2